MHRKPVFLHASWRTGSTYVWSKFRAINDAYCYFEPLNEHLATATQAFVDTFAPWPYAHHPPLEAPYLEEFRPLLDPAGGVPDFPAALAYRHFRSDRRASLPALSNYFEKLIAFAQSRGRTPVFGCVRTDLRVDWFRHHLHGVHIFIRRDPRRQFVSYLNQATKGNRYFLERGWVVLGSNRDDPAFEPLRRLLDIPAYDGSPEGRDEFYARQAWHTPWARLYMIFYYLNRLSMRALAAHGVDFVIDLDRASDDPSAARKVEAAMAALTGASISFSDCKIETYGALLRKEAAGFGDIEAEVEALLDGQETDPAAA